VAEVTYIIGIDPAGTPPFDLCGTPIPTGATTIATHLSNIDVGAKIFAGARVLSDPVFGAVFIVSGSVTPIPGPVPRARVTMNYIVSYSVGKALSLTIQGTADLPTSPNTSVVFKAEAPCGDMLLSLFRSEAFLDVPVPHVAPRPDK